jgi:hypothetical protein
VHSILVHDILLQKVWHHCVCDRVVRDISGKTSENRGIPEEKPVERPEWCCFGGQQRAQQQHSILVVHQ